MRQNKALVVLILLLICSLALIGCTPNDNADSSPTAATTPSGVVADNNEPTPNDSTATSTAEPDATTETTNTNPPTPNPATASTGSTDNADDTDSSNPPTDTIVNNPSNEPVANADLHCTISINCSSIAEHLDDLDEAKIDFVPADGWLLEPIEVVFYEGESAFNVLLRTCKQNKLHMEYRDTPIYNSAYICGIGNLYEFDCGDLSGWMYAVNGSFPNYGCSQYTLADGDTLEFIYTCDLGASEQANINL